MAEHEVILQFFKWLITFNIYRQKIPCLISTGKLINSVRMRQY